MPTFHELESYDSGSNYSFSDKMIQPNFPEVVLTLLILYLVLMTTAVLSTPLLGSKLFPLTNFQLMSRLLCVFFRKLFPFIPANVFISTLSILDILTFGRILTHS